MHCREDPIVTTNDLIGWGTHDLRAVLANAACPVTFVAGEDDLWVNADAVQRAARAVPDGRFELLHGYGHYPMEEMDDFAALLHRWIVDMLDRSTP
jgi:pimeloyl-ACP methyl ester carboxylesterase